MAIREIPLRTDVANSKFNLPIEGTFYTLEFRWNSRMSNWFMDIKTLNEESILNGIPVFTNFDLIGRFKNILLPEGELLFYDTSGEATDPTRYDLGERVVLFYKEAA